MTDEILTPEQIWLRAQEFWADEAVSIDDAIKADLVPFTLKAIQPSKKEQQKRAVRMYLAEYIGQIMSTQKVSDEQMVMLLKKDDQLYTLCQFIKKTLPTAWWVKTQAPLFVGNAIIVKWPELKKRNREPLIPALIRAISLGVANNERGTDYYVFLRQEKQAKSFSLFCHSIQGGVDEEVAEDNTLSAFARDY